MLLNFSKTSMGNTEKDCYIICDVIHCKAIFMRLMQMYIVLILLYAIFDKNTTEALHMPYYNITRGTLLWKRLIDSLP
jgi:hypothetical protein